MWNIITKTKKALQFNIIGKLFFKIGELFKMDYSAVSQAAKRFEQKNKVNGKIKEGLQKVITALKEI